MTATTIPLFDDVDEPSARGRRTRARRADAARPSEPDCLLTAIQAAEVLSIGRSKLYELVARGAVQSVKLDRCRRFRRSDLDRYIRSLPVAPA
jgi:excisionase family DNA binding protein